MGSAADKVSLVTLMCVMCVCICMELPLHTQVSLCLLALQEGADTLTTPELLSELMRCPYMSS